MSAAAGGIPGSAAPRRAWSFLPFAITGCLLVVGISEWALLSMRIGRLETSSQHLDKIVGEIFHQQRGVNDAAQQQGKQAKLQVDAMEQQGKQAKLQIDAMEQQSKEAKLQIGAMEQQSKQAKLQIDAMEQQSKEGKNELVQLKLAQSSIMERLASTEKVHNELRGLIDSLKAEIRKVADAAADQTSLAKTVESLQQDLVKMSAGVALNKDELQRLGASHDHMHKKMAWHTANSTSSPVAGRAVAKVEAGGASSPVAGREVEAGGASSPVARREVVAKAHAGWRQVPAVDPSGKEAFKDYEQLEELLKAGEGGQQHYEDYKEGELLLEAAEEDEQRSSNSSAQDVTDEALLYGAYEDLEADEHEYEDQGLDAGDQTTGEAVSKSDV